MTIDYSYWQDALALGDAIKNDREHRAPMEPQAGFYRTRINKAVAIWPDDDGMNFIVEGRQLHPHEMEDVWLEVCRRPVTEQQWRDYGEKGVWWDFDPVLNETFGHNLASAEDPEAIAAMLATLQEAAKRYVKIEDEEASKRAHGIRNRINDLRLRAEKLHKAEKEPHLKAGQAVDRKWNPMVKDATTAAAGLARAMAAWEDAKRAAVRRAEWEAEEAARKAEEARRAAEAAGLPPPEPVAVPEAPSLPEPSAQIRSAYGKAANVKMRLTVTEVTDWSALLRRYSQRSELKDLLMKLAQQDVDSGLDVPGVKVEEKAVVR